MARTCTVSFTDLSGTVHKVEISTAESVYEAAVAGVAAITNSWGEEPGLLTPIRVEVVGPVVTHEVTMKQVRAWLDGTCRSPREKVLKERLKGMLNG